MLLCVLFAVKSFQPNQKITIKALLESNGMKQFVVMTFCCLFALF